MYVYPKHLTEPGRLDVAGLQVLCAKGEAGPVGSCSCGGYLMVDCPVRSWRAGGPVWVQLVCLACRHEVACPDGRLAPHRADAHGAA